MIYFIGTFLFIFYYPMSAFKAAENVATSACSIYLTHGGGPYPILEKNLHQGMYQHLSALGKKYPNPKAIIVFSAHWEEA
jgi:aromatic ring-opening dioxygenase catalytic subunit (LigB family)